MLLADFHVTGLDRPFEGEQALAAFAANPQDAAAMEELIVPGIEEAVFLEAASPQHGGADARGEDARARFLGTLEP